VKPGVDLGRSESRFQFPVTPRGESLLVDSLCRRLSGSQAEEMYPDGAIGRDINHAPTSHANY
jgi:hypothetical protein